MVKYSRPATGYARPINGPNNRTVVRRRSTNAPVKKKLITKKTNRAAAATNKAAIMTLSKQVKNLQLQRYGFKQFQHQHITGISEGSTLDHMTPNITKPYAFLVNDFYNAAGIWYGGVTNQAPVLTHEMKFNRVENDLDIATSYLWNHKQQMENVSQTQYLPISSTMQFKIAITADVTFTVPVRCRIQIFKFKNQTVNGKFQMSLPYNLGAYWHLCDTNPTSRNHLNTNEYHQVVYDRSVLFKPTIDHASASVEERYLKAKIQFPAKAVKLDDTTDPTGQKLYNVIPSKDQYWCIISADTFSANRVKVFVERWNVWRDSIGVGS